MKILLCTIPIRSQPSNYPPVACTSLLNTLIKNGYNPEFYDINLRRPSFDELSEFFLQRQFDIVGISAVVSTGYKYTKTLSHIIKKVSPKTKIILGGNLSSAHEVILHRCKVDICVMGEGEKVLLNLVKHLEKYGDFDTSNPALHKIRGINFINSEGISEFTGYEEPNDYVAQPDYALLERFSDINHYIYDPLTTNAFVHFEHDPRSYLPHRRGKKIATVLASKGCTNRCTFCHRWIKGYRIVPVEEVIANIKYLAAKYNVGFFNFADECFGANKQWVEKFIELIKPLDVLFYVGAARVSLIKNNPGIIGSLKEAGLTTMYFGMESGSDKILNIMEKNTTCADNLRIAKACAEAGVSTSIQLVIGMPGENEETINDTTEFVKKAMGYFSYPIPLSFNYLHNLPGTPCYGFLRKYGFLGTTIEDEEQYLLGVSDVEAADYKQYVNISEEPLSKVSLWQKKIYISARIYWIKQHGYDVWLKLRKYNLPVGSKLNKEKSFKTIAIERVRFFIFNSKMVKYKHIKLMENFYWNFLIFKKRTLLYGIKKALLITFGIAEEEDRRRFKIDGIGLSKIIQFAKGPKVSVVIPTHNHAHFLHECLSSVKAQTYKDYEVIVVNNGSTDNTEAVMSGLAWEKLKYHYQSDTGSVAGPRNTGIRLARGEYVAFLDSDDLWHRQKLERVMAVLEKNADIDILSHDLFLAKGGKKKNIMRCGPLKKNMFKALLIRNYLLGSATVAKRKALLEVGGFDESKDFVHVEDCEIWLRAAYAGKNFYFINEALGEYRIHSTNLSRDFEHVIRSEKNLIDKHIKKFKSRIPFHGYFLYTYKLSSIYFKLGMQYFFRKEYNKCLYNLSKSFFLNPFSLPFNLLCVVRSKSS